MNSTTLFLRWTPNVMCNKNKYVEYLKLILCHFYSIFPYSETEWFLSEAN